MKKISGVYQIRNIVNGKRYIGSSVDVHRRLIIHRCLLNCKKHTNQILQRSWDKYGSDNFDFSILLYCNSNETLKYEQEFLDVCTPEYNIAKSAKAPFLGRKWTKEALEKRTRSFQERNGTLDRQSHPMTEETKRALREANAGRTNSIESNIKRSKKLKGRHPWNFGKTLSEEHKKKVGEAGKGRVVSDESRRKRSQSLRGKTSWCKGMTKSDEFKEKVSAGLRAYHAMRKAQLLSEVA